MAWAVRADSLMPVHVVMLGRGETGLACNCLCPGCGSVVQAVNVGHAAAHYLKQGVTRPFFRHHHTPQGEGCKQSVARLATLHLLFDRDEIALPAPRAVGFVQGISGTAYKQYAGGQSFTAAVIGKQWIDAHSASLTLADGKVICLRLSSSTRVDQDMEMDGVLTVDVDDPDVANWSPEQILAKVQLDGSWLRWVRHWDDESLAAQALQNARDAADNALDTWPADLSMPEGMTTMQRSESVLHWALKEALAASGQIYVPAVEENFSARDGSGKAHSDGYEFPARTLQLQGVRLEAAMGDIVPDVVCRAVDPVGELSIECLLIEVAVTHRVDSAKLQKIVDRGVACLEIDSSRFSRSGTVTRAELPSLLLHDGVVRWLHHPRILLASKEANERLSRHVREANEKETKRTTRIAAIERVDGAEAHRFLLAALRASWYRHPQVTHQHQSFHPPEVIEVLLRRLPASSSSDLIFDHGGLVWMIEQIRAEGQVQKHGSTFSLLMRARSAGALGRYITHLLIAARVYQPPMTDEQKGTIAELRSQVWTSVESGELKFARPAIYDAVIAAMFPEMGDLLGNVVGTEGYALKRKREIDKKSMEEERARAAVEEALARERSRAEFERERRDELKRAILRASHGDWQPAQGHPHDIEQASHITKHLRCRYVDREVVIRKAWEGRANGLSLPDWYQSLGLNDVYAVAEVASILREAYLKL